MHWIGMQIIPTMYSPKKHHLAEFNPSVAKLPKSYLTNDKWLQTFGGNGSQPIYLATYRISNFMACYFGLKLNKIKFNNDYNNWMRTKPKTEFIGFALLNSELDIVADITVDFGFKWGVFGKNYQDFRIFNLRGGDGEKEMLYISTFDFIVPIQLTLDVPEINESLTGYTKLHPPDIFLSTNISNQQQPKHKFLVWHRNYKSCIKSKGKNFLYFDEIMTTNVIENDTAVVTRSKTRILFWARSNPNEVLSLDLTESCNRPGGRLPSPSYTEELKKFPAPYPEPSFQTMELEMYPSTRGTQFHDDRGSACCIRVPKNKIPIAPSMVDHVRNVTNNSDDNTLMIAIVHVKTKGHPSGVPKNIYLSRFIAFLPHEPYSIVARSGLFCLGWFTENENILNHPKYHNIFVEENALQLGPEKLASCPRIHFIMSMIEKHDTVENQVGITINKNEEEAAVIISYGISDCYSRIVEVKKKTLFACSSQIIPTHKVLHY